MEALLSAPQILLPDATVLKRDRKNEIEPDGGVFVSFVGNEEDLTADFVVFEKTNGTVNFKFCHI